MLPGFAFNRAVYARYRLFFVFAALKTLTPFSDLAPNFSRTFFLPPPPFVLFFLRPRKRRTRAGHIRAVFRTVKG